MPKRLRFALVTLALSGAIVGGGAAIASAASGSSGKASTKPSTTMHHASTKSGKGNCPNM